MKTLRIIAALSLAILLGPAANGQSLSGRVVDGKDRTPVAGAQAVVLSLPDSAVAAFTVTDAEGVFDVKKELRIPFCLRISCMGFATKVVPVMSAPRKPMQIEIMPKVFDLKEVAVRKRAPGAAVKGDTVRYNLRKFTDGTEQVLGEVLDKLPGIKVTESGKVMAGGKLVDNILLNGQDFTGDRHEVLTKNLPSEMVEKVELIKNYNEYSVLDGFRSKGTAINIGVDSAYTRRPTGNVEIWGGHREKYRAKGSLFFIGPDAMLCANAKVYNTGEETMSNLEYLELCGGVKSFADAISGRSAVVERPAPSVGAYLKADMATRSREDQMVTANAAWNPSGRLRIKAYAIFNREETGSAEDIRRAFIGKDAKEAVWLAERADNDRRATSGRVEVKYETGANGIVSYLGTVSGSPESYAEASNFRGDTRWEADRRNIHTSHDVSFAQRIAKDQLLTLRAYAGLDRGKTDVRLSSDTALAVGYASGVWQSTRDMTTMAGGSASYILRLKGKVKLRAGVAYDFDRGGYRAESPEDDLAAPSSRSDCQSAVFSFSLHKIKGRLKADAGLHLARVSSDASRVRWKLLPEASLTLNFSKLHSLELSYESSLSRDGAAPWAATRRLAGYRTLYDFAARDEMFHLLHNADLFYMFYDRFADISVNLFGGINVEMSPCAYDMSTRADALVESRASSTRADRGAYFQLSVDKGFAIPLRAKIGARGQGSLAPVLYDGDKYTTRAYDVTADLSLKTRFRAPLNVEAGGSYSFARTAIELMDGPSEWRSCTIRVQPIAASKRLGLKAKVPVSYVRDISNGQRAEYVDISFEATKKLGARFSVFTEARDLLHSDRQERVTTSVSGDTEDTATESRMPGFIVAGVKWIF